MKIIIAKNAGFCFGVKRAVRIALDAAEEEEVYTLGALIHNPPMVEKMSKKGVLVADDFNRLDNKRVIIPSHGISPDILEKIKPNGIPHRVSRCGVKDIIDATCPFVKIAREEAVKLSNICDTLIIVGDKKHPEIRGILPFLRSNVIVVENTSEIPDKRFGRCGIIAQTTMSEAIFKDVALQVSKRSKNLKVVNTICDATRKRQSSTLKLLKDVDMMIVIGGHNSANTRQLLQLCVKNKKRAYQVENETELKKKWFKNCGKVGITAGASTPPWMIKRVKEKILSLA